MLTPMSPHRALVERDCTIHAGEEEAGRTNWDLGSTSQGERCLTQWRRRAGKVETVPT